MTLAVVDLPAPLGPIRPVHSPTGTSRSTSLTATWPPKRTVAPRTSSSAMSVRFAAAGAIPSGQTVEEAVGLDPALVEVAHEPEAQEPGERPLEVESTARRGHGHAEHREHQCVPLGEGVRRAVGHEVGGYAQPD